MPSIITYQRLTPILLNPPVDRSVSTKRGILGEIHETKNLCQIYGVRSSDYANWTCGRGDCFTSFDRTER